jgi:hypothetical protein
MQSRKQNLCPVMIILLMKNERPSNGRMNRKNIAVMDFTFFMPFLYTTK